LDTKGKEGVWGFDQKVCDRHAFYIGYNVTNVFYSSTKSAKGVWGLAPREIFTITFPTMLEAAPLQTSLESSNLKSLAQKDNNKIPNYQDPKVMGGQDY